MYLGGAVEKNASCARAEGNEVQEQLYHSGRDIEGRTCTRVQPFGVRELAEDP
jgi:hypothetical protein